MSVFAAHGFFGTSAITALTVQSTLGVAAVHPTDARVLAETLECLVADLPPAGIKIGMLATEKNVRAAIEFLVRLRMEGVGFEAGNGWLVLDPVMRSSSGRELLSREGISLLRERLLPLVDWVTPNLAELAALTDRRIGNSGEMEVAASQLAAAYPGLNVAATGGHLDRADDLIALEDGQIEWLRGEKIASHATHGTGCAFSSALLCGLLRELGGVKAATLAKKYVAEAIRSATPAGGGEGPMNLIWPLTHGNLAALERT